MNAVGRFLMTISLREISLLRRLRHAQHILFTFFLETKWSTIRIAVYILVALNVDLIENVIFGIIN